MFASATAKTRRAKPSHELWTPHNYQERAVDFLVENNAAALFLDPGLGKTSITLEAFRRLKANGMADKMLVVAPLRVCQLVWPSEGKKWTQFRDLRVSVLHGSKKADRLKDDADIWLINPEGIPWLSERFFGRSLPFDTVVIDELTKFKNHRSQRSKKLRPRMKGVQRRWGLTGTPAPNGYMDLFGQFLMLDDGAALGKYITHYRDLYFQPDFNGFDYSLQPGGAKRIEKRIAPYVLRMKAEDYLDLPDLIDDPREIEMDAKSRKAYTKMKNDMLVELPDGVVTAANAGAVYSKLSQMANGAVYIEDGLNRKVAHIHDAKLDALEELIDELAGEQLLIAYEFNHDLSRLQDRFGKDIPYIGKGVSEKRAKELETAWNKGEIPFLAAHPASVGHGLNFQGSSASHICWFSMSWDLELYEQFIKRLLRQGTLAKSVINHQIIVRDTIDSLKLSSLRDKDVTQESLLTNLSTLLDIDVQETQAMAVRKLSRKNSNEEAQEEAPTRRVAPKGWGAPANDDAPDGQDNDAGQDEEQEQRQRISNKLKGDDNDANDDGGEEQEPLSSKARSAFSKEVQDKLAGEDSGEEEPKAEEKPKRTRKKKVTKAEEDHGVVGGEAAMLGNMGYVPPAVGGNINFNIDLGQLIQKKGQKHALEVMAALVDVLDSAA